MAEKGRQLIGVRLDSGDMVELSRGVRKILDDAGLTDAKIFASSGFDEHKIARVIEAGARIDAFGVGTRLGVSADAPYFDIVYKMVHFKDRDIRKLSPGKANLAGEKQVFRKSDANGMYLEDVIGLKDEAPPENARPLLQTVMEKGRPVAAIQSLTEVREGVRDHLSRLAAPYKALDGAERYPVAVSNPLSRIQTG